MQTKAFTYFLISCSLVILINLYVQPSNGQLVPVPKSVNVNTQSHCGFVDKSYNHYAYQELSQSLLEPIGNGQMLHREASRAFAEMRLAAKKDGIILTPVSGFRSVDQQQNLFYQVAKQRKQTLAQRAKVSAPPGYSQHHTGLAVDINSLDTSFEKTTSFAWLQRNAENFGFMLSFPRNNPQGIGYEPWHWAWHGTEEAGIALHEGCI